ncbi:MAG: DUF2791 family P-loop domain-containing protein, partial [Anaerolineales bacterium]|nr:DUF2791 family P-loop domain-containing protein [Anaerolineales bacterium]
MTQLDPMVARRIIEQVASTGQPPQVGLEYFTSGLDPYMSVLENDYFKSYLREGGSGFKLVVGVYGGGKTHFMYCVRNLAWAHNYATAYVSLNPSDSPFHRLEAVYRAIARSLTPPLSTEELLSGYEEGMASFIRIWFAEVQRRLANEGWEGDELRDELIRASRRLEGLESLSFARAVGAAFRALIDGQEEAFADICQWLTGEGYDRARHRPYGILQRVDKTTAFP